MPTSPKLYEEIKLEELHAKIAEIPEGEPDITDVHIFVDRSYYPQDGAFPWEPNKIIHAYSKSICMRVGRHLHAAMLIKATEMKMTVTQYCLHQITEMHKVAIEELPPELKLELSLE